MKNILKLKTLRLLEGIFQDLEVFCLKKKLWLKGGESYNFNNSLAYRLLDKLEDYFSWQSTKYYQIKWELLETNCGIQQMTLQSAGFTNVKQREEYREKELKKIHEINTNN